MLTLCGPLGVTGERGLEGGAWRSRGRLGVVHLAIPGDGLAVSGGDPKPTGAKGILYEGLPRAAGHTFHGHWFTQGQLSDQRVMKDSPRQFASSVKQRRSARVRIAPLGPISDSSKGIRGLC